MFLRVNFAHLERVPFGPGGWAGAPAEVIMDPAQTMLGENPQSLFEAHGTNVKLIA